MVVKKMAMVAAKNYAPRYKMKRRALNGVYCQSAAKQR
jgi:hypothetical protein